MENFFKNKTILVTGHTGFKGSWLSEILCKWGANVVGYSLNPPTNPNLFDLLELKKKMTSVIGDIRDFNKLNNIFHEHNPDIIIHMAAQPIVRESYKNPVYTYDTNVMGTVNICECVRNSNSVKSFLNVTTDKVYENRDQNHSFKEYEKLDGWDPYSNSKSCSELVTHSYNNSFFKELDIRCSTARAGNVIGGGDFAKDRIIPDCVRASINKEDIIIRNPHSIRPYQHVLEPVLLYLTIVMKQYEDKKFADYYNVGPDDFDCLTTGKIASLYCEYFNKDCESEINWIDKSDNGPHEATLLKLDNQKIKDTFDWKSVWNTEKAVEKTVEWTKAYMDNLNIKEFTDNQINEYLKKYG